MKRSIPRGKSTSLGIGALRKPKRRQAIDLHTIIKGAGYDARITSQENLQRAITAHVAPLPAPDGQGFKLVRVEVADDQVASVQDDKPIRRGQDAQGEMRGQARDKACDRGQ